MGRLTKRDRQGNWCIKGLPWKDIHIGQVITENTHEKIYGAFCKLLDYEEIGLTPEQVQQLKERKVEIDENNKVPDWAYRDWGNEEEIKMIHLIEKALGFKLFFWQKTYITRGYFRQTGRTTAIIIRILTQGTKPVDLSNDRAIREYLDIDCPKYSAGLACGIFKREVKEIHEKLVRAGIKTNPVFYTKKDKEEFLRRR